MNPAIVAMIAVVLSILTILLVFRFGKVFFKFLIAILLIFITVSVIIGSVAFNDAIDFQKEFKTSQNLFLLTSENSVLAGVNLKVLQKTTGGVDAFRQTIEDQAGTDLTDYLDKVGSDIVSEEAGISMSFLNKDAVSKIQNLYEQEDYELMLENRFKLLLTNIDVIDNVEVSYFNFGNYTISKELMKDLLLSNDTISLLLEELSEGDLTLKSEIETAFLSEFSSDEKLRSYLFALVLEKFFTGSVNDVPVLMSWFKSEVIEVYPETIMFKMLDVLPEPVVAVLAQQVEEEET